MSGLTPNPEPRITSAPFTASISRAIAVSNLSLIVGSMLPELSQVAEGFVSASALLKITIFFTAWLMIWLPIAIPLGLQFHWRPFLPLPIGQKLSLVLSLYAIAPFLLWGIISLETVSVSVSASVSASKYGLVWQFSAFSALIAGLSLGVAGVGLMFGLEWLLGWVEWQPIKTGSIVPIFWLPLGLGLVISAIEEPVFRGFLFTQLQQQFQQQQYGDWLAAAISSLIFALLHLIWDGKQAGPQLPGLWLMGLVLVLARQITGGNLGLACGLHAGWIWAMASLDAAQVIRKRDRAPIWMTGFAGQPLAGGMGLLMLMLTGSILWGFRWVFK